MINLLDYESLALRTLKPHDSKALAISDWALGLGGELGEVVALVQNNSEDKMEMSKELGDILWYTVALTKELDLKLPATLFEDCVKFAGDRTHCPTCMVDEAPRNTAVLSLTVLVGMVQEKIKHIIMHKEEQSFDTTITWLCDIVLNISMVAALDGFSLYEVAELNVGKLAHRYNVKMGGEYSVQASANRHSTEEKFTDTETYKRLYDRIMSK